MMSVLKEGDERVRFLVKEDQYIRRLTVENLTISLTGPEPIELGVPFDSISYQGLPIGNWICHRVMAMLGMNPIVSGSFVDACHLVRPVEMVVGETPVEVTQIDANVTVSGSWYVQPIELDATTGAYDWLRRRVRVGPSGQFHLKGVDLTGGKAVEQAPDWVTTHDLRPGEVAFGLLHLEGLGPVDPRPDLDEVVRPEDLSLRVPKEMLDQLDGVARDAE